MWNGEKNTYGMKRKERTSRGRCCWKRMKDEMPVEDAKKKWTNQELDILKTKKSLFE